MYGAVLDLLTGAISVLLGIVMLLRPTASGAQLSRALGRLGLGTPSRASMHARGAVFLAMGVGLMVIGWHFR